MPKVEGMTMSSEGTGVVVSVCESGSGRSVHLLVSRRLICSGYI